MSPLEVTLPDVTFRCVNPSMERTARYIHDHWKELIKTSPPHTLDQLLYLPYPYVVPGGVFQQLFYWDSYFILLGLKISRLTALARQIVDNFLYEIKTFGLVPNSSEIAHLSRSQPPFLTSMIKEVYDGDKTWLQHAYKMAKVEYHQVWMDPNTHFIPQVGLNRYFDDIEKMLRIRGEAYLHFDEIYLPPAFLQERAEAESGWDYTARFNRQCASFIPVDLNALLYRYETDFAHIAKILDRDKEAADWKKRAFSRKQTMDHYLWNEQHGVYFDYDFVRGHQYPYFSLATFYPLWAEAASPRQAEKVRQNLSRFLHRGGAVTSTTYSGFQWDYPNGWAPLQWIVTKGLLHYGYRKEAEQIANHWLSLCTHIFERYGKLFEKYNVVDFNIRTPGRYPLQEGFGWTNGIYLKLATEFGYCQVESE
ncbi:trehalase family glycosidase [Desmospora profundinema]|uniref:trehalase family glycosidase n=1 Tax=Desmospora profundinema TaxID=1571184 RepID=UPI00286C6106|nr:trehalase family glycosidase [Desmospora profundinema]